MCAARAVVCSWCWGGVGAASGWSCAEMLSVHLSAAGELSSERRRQLVQGLVAEVSAGKAPFERIANWVEIPMLSPDDGTLTRSFKPRKEAILQKYAEQVSKLKRQLR